MWLTARKGCNELIFNPIIQWWYKGPITKQLRTFMWSNAPAHYKIGMMSCESSAPAQPEQLLTPSLQTCSRTVRTPDSRGICKHTDSPPDALSGAFVLSAMNYFLLGWNLPVSR